MLSRYYKCIAALVLGGLGWASVVVASEPSAVTNAEWQQLIAVGIAAAGVFFVPNAAAKEQ